MNRYTFTRDQIVTLRRGFDLGILGSTAPLVDLVEDGSPAVLETVQDILRDAYTDHPLLTFELSDAEAFAMRGCFEVGVNSCEGALFGGPEELKRKWREIGQVFDACARPSVLALSTAQIVLDDAAESLALRELLLHLPTLPTWRPGVVREALHRALLVYEGNRT